MPKLVHVWSQLDNEVSNWFSQLSSIEWVCEFLLLVYHCSTKEIDFRLQTAKSEKKGKKTTSFEKWLLGGILQNRFPKNFTKFTEKYLC